VNPRYAEVFRTHRLVFLLPVVLAGAVALWVALAAPPMYRSSATLWSDAAGGSSGYLSPSEQDQQLLNELLATRYFQGLVAEGSPLATYLEDHPAHGWAPTALLGRLRSAPTLDARIAAALGPTRVVTYVHGPHVLEVTHEAPAPELAQATLDVVVKQFIRNRGAFRRDALAAAERKIAEASKALDAARTDLMRYLDAHPGASTTDPQLKALVTTERLAVMTLTNATDTINRAAASLSSETVVRVVDSPETPLGPTTGRARLVMALFGGLFAGALVSILGIVAVAKARGGRGGLDAVGAEAPDTPAPDGGSVSGNGSRVAGGATR
jgi:hypothetical protein